MTVTYEASPLPFDSPVPTGPAVRRNGPRTSIEAARTCDASRQRDVLARELSATLHGLTADELESATGIPRYVVASRLAWWLRAVPRVVDVGTESGLL